MELNIKHGSAPDAALMMMPLGVVAPHLVADMRKHGKGKRCGVCGKPFNQVRKWRSVARVVVGGAGASLLATHWLLCGLCSRESKQNAGRVPAILRDEAHELACSVLPLADVKCKGAA